MSPQIRPLIAGLAAPGLLWLATSVALGQAAPAPQGPPLPAPTSPTTYQALLLSNGQVVRGEIAEDPAAGVFRHRQKVGTVQYPRAMVQKAAGSVEELYRFQVARLPVGDPEERMKLARWCLTEHLPDQAREQLVAVQQMSPDDREVKRMLFNLDATASRPGVDPEIRRTSAEQPADQPAALDPRFLANVQKHFNTVPVIFDLPPAVAVGRAGEFATFVQPVLLQNCARCHNEKYQGTFQLVEIRTPRDHKNPDIPRANLDAALRLVNPDDPARSDLLSAGLVPHGGNKNAVFRGPNDRQYQAVASWVKSLKPTQPAGRGPVADVSRTGYAPAESSGEGFGADRAGRTPGPRGAAPLPLPRPAAPYPAIPHLPDMAAVAEAAAATPPPSKRVVERFQEDADFHLKAGENPEFPVPFAAGGVPPTRPAPNAPRPTRPAAEAPQPATPPAVQPKTATPVGPNAVAVGSADDPNQLPGMNQPLYPTAPAARADDDDEAKPVKKKEKKIDNALLEKLMKNRNANP